MKYNVIRGVSWTVIGGGDTLMRWEVGDVLDSATLPKAPKGTPALDIKGLLDRGAIEEVSNG